MISKSITVDSILQLSNVLQRRPVIWDNLHANDYDQRRLFLGPYAGRSADLYPYLDGILTNPNCEFESNFMAINGLALWYQHGKAAASGGSGGESPAAELMDVDSPAAADTEKNPVGYDAVTSLRAGIQEWLAEFQKPTLASVLRRKTVSAAATTQLEKEGEGGDDSATAAAPTFDSEDSAAKRQRRPDGGGTTTTTTTTSSREKLSEEDVAWIVDLFYLPHEHGPRAEELMREFHWLKSHANNASRAATETETTMSDEESEEFAQQVVSQVLGFNILRESCRNKCCIS